MFATNLCKLFFLIFFTVVSMFKMMPSCILQSSSVTVILLSSLYTFQTWILPSELKKLTNDHSSSRKSVPEKLNILKSCMHVIMYMGKYATF
jgi:hypothetical protein